MLLVPLFALACAGEAWNFINPDPEHQKVMAVHRQKVLKLGNKMRARAANGTASEKVANPWNSNFVQSSLVHELYTEVMKLDVAKEDFDVSCIKSMSGELRDPSSFDDAVRAHIVRRGLFSRHADVRVDSGRWGRGALAARSFEPGETVGQYVGNEYMDFEFSALHPSECVQWYYSMHVTYMAHAKQGKYLKKSLFKPPKQGIPIPKDVEIVVDGCGDGTPRGSSPLAFVNDCRLNISEASMTMEDRMERRNVEFVYCAIDRAAVFPFLVSTAHIKEGEELLTYYGPAYTLNDAQLNRSNALASTLSTAAHSSDSTHDAAKATTTKIHTEDETRRQWQPPRDDDADENDRDEL